MRGIRRTAGAAPAQKGPATADRIAAMLEAILADTLRGKRTRALLRAGLLTSAAEAGVDVLRMMEVSRH